MNEHLGRLSARYKKAEGRVGAAEAEVRGASENRLAELLKLPPLQRLRQIDDPILTQQDRLTLRRSMEARLRQGRRIAIPFPRRSLFRGSRRWRRYIPTLLILAAAVAVSGMLTYKAWQNTYQVLPLSAPVDFDWTLPDGTKQRKVMPAGGNLAVKFLTDTSAIARRWIEREGYATAKVNIQK